MQSIFLIRYFLLYFYPREAELREDKKLLQARCIFMFCGKILIWKIFMSFQKNTKSISKVMIMYLYLTIPKFLQAR